MIFKCQNRVQSKKAVHKNGRIHLTVITVEFLDDKHTYSAIWGEWSWFGIKFKHIEALNISRTLLTFDIFFNSFRHNV